MKPLASAILILLSLLAFPSCNDDLPEPRSEDEILGIWSDSDDRYLDFLTPDRMYAYTLFDEEGYKYCLKSSPMYFYEPYSQLLCLMDREGIMQIYKVLEISADKLVMCWVATPEITAIDGNQNFDFLKIFFDQTYELNPENYTTFRRLTLSELSSILATYEIIDF